MKKKQAENASKPVEAQKARKKPPHPSAEDFESKVDLPGKTDSGPEPDVFGREIPPQE